jgi:hypothetical protein
MRSSQRTRNDLELLWLIDRGNHQHVIEAEPFEARQALACLFGRARGRNAR